MPWDSEFDPPVPGFKTLRHAAKYMMKLPASEREKPHWQTTAALVVPMAAEDRGPMLHAVIGISRP
jgi:hypothetical protein